MGKWLAVAGVVALVTGCNYGAHQFACTSDEQCKSGALQDGLCQGGQCSFPDGSCDGGRRYGDVSGGRGECVVPIDAGIGSEPIPDVPPPDARLCFGAIFPICLAAAPAGPLDVSSNMKFDTSLPGTCAATTSGGNGICVVAATTITINNAELRGIGNKPLVLLASDSITVTGATGEIDVGNHRGDADVGAGANPTCPGGTQPQTGGNDGAGGGAGGSFTGTGGPGGVGGGAVGGNGTAPAGTPGITTLRGGCPGQQGGDNGGAGGRGGGAVYLVAGNRIEIAGRGVNAGGEGAGGGANAESGGGGGGSGGMIVLDAQTVTCTALLVANGGGGGEGADAAADGNPGLDATETDPANGGSGAVAIGGNGGPGSAGLAAGAGGIANSGAAGGGGNDGAGGGGGGAAGLIRATAGANLGAMVSPASTP